MKKILLSMVAVAVAPLAFADVTTSETTTTTTTEGGGTITEYMPGSAIVLKEASGPRHYRIGKTVTYITRSGEAIPAGEVQTRIKVGAPVRVHYIKEGDDYVVDRVTVEEK